MASTPTRAVNLARQLVAIRVSCRTPAGRITAVELAAVVRFQPPQPAETYTVRD